MANLPDPLAWLQEEKIYLVQTLDADGDVQEDYYVYAQNEKEVETFFSGHLKQLFPKLNWRGKDFEDLVKIPYGPSDFATWKQEGGCFSLKPDEILNRPGQWGWASTKPGQTKYHYYTAEGSSLCSYQRQPGPLHFWKTNPVPGTSVCSSCALAYSRLPKAQQQ